MAEPHFGPRAGLSLIELLVSLALLALIAAGLAGAFGVGVQVFDRAQAVATDQAELALRRQLRATLLEALPPNRITPFPNTFAGDPDKLSFVTLKPWAFAPDAAASRVDVGWSGGALTLTLVAVDDSGAPLDQWDHVLSEGVGDVAFAYLDTSGETPVWEGTWRDRPDLPALVRITGTGGSPEWVDFVVGPRL
ncbi:MAG: prepilin-type N-terminal cleavage/methylation domain-containing protein [Pseudomonadota bacterium]